jgi:hypothetical protein
VNIYVPNVPKQGRTGEQLFLFTAQLFPHWFPITVPTIYYTSVGMFIGSICFPEFPIKVPKERKKEPEKNYFSLEQMFFPHCSQ